MERRIEVVRGDITTQIVDAIVNAANAHLAHGGGVAAAIARAGAPVVDSESRVWVEAHGPVPPGGAAVTSAGSMPADHVVHVVGPIYQDGQENEALLGEAVTTALDAAVELGARSIAMPTISAGIYGYPPAEACRVIVESVATWLSDGGDVDEVRLVAFSDDIVAYYRSALRTQGSQGASRIAGMKPTVAILGAGSMGETFGVGLLRAGWDANDLSIADRRPERIREIEFLTGITATDDVALTVAGKRVIVVAVKPKDVPGLLDLVRETLTSDQVIVSIAAGVTIDSYEMTLPGIPIVRSMPNTPAAIDEGMTAYCGGTHADTEALSDAAVVLGAVGETIELSEDLLDAVTAVSGTGPAYVFLLAEAMTEAAIREGLPHYAAERLVHQTLRGAGMLLAGSDKSAFRLRGNVTSPGGTTAAAIYSLEEGGFRTLMEDAIRAAARRSRELGKRASGDSAE